MVITTTFLYLKNIRKMDCQDSLGLAIYPKKRGQEKVGTLVKRILEVRRVKLYLKAGGANGIRNMARLKFIINKVNIKAPGTLRQARKYQANRKIHVSQLIIPVQRIQMINLLIEW